MAAVLILAGRQTDKHDEDNMRFLQLYEGA